MRTHRFGRKIKLAACRFRILDSCVSMVQPAKNRVRNNVSEQLDRTCVGRVLPERNVSSHFIIIGGILRKNSSKVIFAGYDHMIRHSGRIDPIKRSTYPFCQGERNEVGWSRMPIARTRALNATPNAPSLSRMRYFGALSHGNASVIWCADHSAVGFRVTSTHNNRRGPWPRIRNANSC
jgi:hypothetical protein